MEQAGITVKSKDFQLLMKEVRSCTLCIDQFPHGARPVVQLHPDARVLVAGQAPGSRVHATGIPFDDPSGDRLREWMGIDKSRFYDERQIALMPMGFCYPGKGKSGDLPPVPLCADTWRERLLARLPNIRLILAIGQYAQAWHLTDRHKTLTETVRAWPQYGNGLLPLPHPSPRNNIWIRRNPWFQEEVLPELAKRVANALA